MKLALGLAAVLSFLASTRLVRGSEGPLRFTAQNGEEFHCTVTSDIDMKGVGYSMKIKSVTVFDFRCDSDSAPFEIATTVVREQFSLDMDIPFVGKIRGSIDTAGEKPPQPENPMDFAKAVPYGLFVMHCARVGKPFVLVVDERGIILKARGVQALLDKAVEKIDSDEVINPIVGQSLKQELTFQAFMDGLDGVFVTLPEGPAAAGATWSREIVKTARDKSELKLTEKITLGEATDGIASYTSVTTLVKEGQEIKPEPPPMTTIHSAVADRYRVDVEGALDMAKGRPVFSVSLLEYKATLSVQSPMEGQPREVKQSVKAETTIEHGSGPAPR